MKQKSLSSLSPIDELVDIFKTTGKSMLYAEDLEPHANILKELLISREDVKILFPKCPSFNVDKTTGDYKNYYPMIENGDGKKELKNNGILINFETHLIQGGEKLPYTKNCVYIHSIEFKGAIIEPVTFETKYIFYVRAQEIELEKQETRTLASVDNGVNLTSSNATYFKTPIERLKEFLKKFPDPSAISLTDYYLSGSHFEACKELILPLLPKSAKVFFVNGPTFSIDVNTNEPTDQLFTVVQEGNSFKTVPSKNITTPNYLFKDVNYFHVIGNFIYLYSIRYDGDETFCLRGYSLDSTIEKEEMKKPVTFTISPSIYEKFSALATKKSVNKSQFVENAFKAFIEENEK